ncbi:hypothetical protein [Shouchella shacheensis]|uniref:hypothetical protein n=1 Tax=Shouchella shacheensis TaxID=1649580 RepID=UPI00074007B0|nr:hypothetical protein [Shouchella shacheensis]
MTDAAHNDPRKDSKSTSKDENRQTRVTPKEIAIVTALLTNALYVQSILVDRDQVVQVILQGSLNSRPEMNALLDQVRDVPVGEFLSALLNGR